MSIKIGIVVGEASGDLLASRLMQALSERYSDIQFEGVAGPLMQEAGCRALYDSERLSVMGIVEILGRYKELKAMRTALIQHWQATPPDLFIGVDAPDFNLGLEERLHRIGIPTCHYVSPSVWAWRKGRIKQIKRAVDLMLTLLPFETQIYDDNNVAARFCGHPLADELPMQPDVLRARQELKLPADRPILAVLPGSRDNELKLLAQSFIETAKKVAESVDGLHCVCPLVRPAHSEQIKQLFAQYAPNLPLTVTEGNARTAMAAADAVILASGTATLEATLLKKPMVVAYKVAGMTYAIVRHMVKLSHFALPNLLAKEPRVPEFIQHDVDASAMARELVKLFKDEGCRQAQIEEFSRIHEMLRCDASATAASAIASHFFLGDKHG